METIKEEKKADLEQLLNSLIEKGWKPFGTDNRVFKVLRTKNNWWYFDGGFGNEICFSLREIVSKESGLWQFCMSKGFTPNVSCYRWEKWFYDIDDLTQCEADVSGFDNYGYRLIESSLKDESELEDFLIQNIKIGNED